jgi:hypothetical protein
VIVGMTVAIWRILIRGKSETDLAGSCLAQLEKMTGSPRHPGETPLAWLSRLEPVSPNGPVTLGLKTMAASYERLVYAPGGRCPENIAALKSATKRLTRIWRKSSGKKIEKLPAGSCG